MDLEASPCHLPTSWIQQILDIKALKLMVGQIGQDKASDPASRGLHLINDLLEEL